MSMEYKKEWEKTGYVAYTNDKKKILIVIKNVRYLVNLDDLQSVLGNKLDYALVFKRIE